MKKINNDQLKELEELKARSILILKFIDKLVPINEPHYSEKFIELINQAYKSKNLTGIRLLAKDIKEWSKGLNREQMKELNYILKKEFGETKVITENEIKAIVSRGHILKKSEYKILFDYFEEIYQDKSKQKEIKNIRLLLEDFQKRHGKV